MSVPSAPVSERPPSAAGSRRPRLRRRRRAGGQPRRDVVDDGEAFALGADAFALVLDGMPEELWRRGAAALWALDPGAGGPGLRCSFGAAVLMDGSEDAGAALARAEDRLASQRNRAPSVAER